MNPSEALPVLRYSLGKQRNCIATHTHATGPETRRAPLCPGPRPVFGRARALSASNEEPLGAHVIVELPVDL